MLNTVPTVLPNSGAKPFDTCLNLFHVRVRYRDQADPGAVAFRVVAAIDFVIDAAVKPVRVDLARNPEFSVRDAADVRLKEDEVVRVS